MTRAEIKNSVGSMLGQMLNTIKEHGLIAPKDVVLAAVSGGPDSVALLEGLLRLREELSFSVTAAHLNHRLRGPDSDEDERFVRSLVERRGVPLIVEARQVSQIREKKGGSLEEIAREVRYAFLRRAAGKCGAKRIALGHNLDDNVETFLMNLIRGSGLRGLSGMPMLRREGRFVVIRPLLQVTREEILSFLKKENLPYREDRSNRDTAYTRNRIRHVLLPLLEREYNPQIRRVLIETARRLREAEDAISALCEGLARECVSGRPEKVRVRTGPLRAQPPSLGKEFLRRVAKERLGINLEPQKLDLLWELVIGTATESVGLGNGYVSCREYDNLQLTREAPVQPLRFERALAIPSDVFLAELGVQISVSVVPRKGVTLRRLPERLGEAWREVWEGREKRFVEFFDAEALGDKGLVVRTRREGDVFCPHGMEGSRKVKELFIDEKAPARLRERIPIFEANGEIMWVVGHRPAAKFAVKKTSEKLLRLDVKVLYCAE